MSQVTTQPTITLPARVRTRGAALLAAGLALVAATAIVLILALDGGSSSSQQTGGATARDGFNTAVSSQSLLSEGASSPDESHVAAAVGSASAASTGPDESRIAASVAGH
jgi:hypothetical protein